MAALNSRVFFKPVKNTFGHACPWCQKFATLSPLYSGHNRWSKIKHDKAREDRSKNRLRSIASHEIAQASKFFGPDPTSNPRLAQAILLAKRAGFPKPSIEAAINRGQGISPSGAALESVTIEAVLPSSVAAVIECQTDSKARTLQDLRLIIREHGGSVMPTSYLFERKGKVVFEKSEDVGLETVFDQAIEAGATDVDEDEEGRIVVYTEPCQTTEAADALVSSAGLTIQSADIIWDANEDTRVELDSEASEKALDKCVEAIEQDPSVHGVYLNIA